MLVSLRYGEGTRVLVGSVPAHSADWDGLMSGSPCVGGRVGPDSEFFWTGPNKEFWRFPTTYCIIPCWHSELLEIEKLATVTLEQTQFTRTFQIAPRVMALERSRTVIIFLEVSSSQYLKLPSAFTQLPLRINRVNAC
jgi:hypothetical protein